MNTPKLYATFLLWMLSELFEQLPEVGDMDKPKLVFFFDEAHLLFSNASPALQEKIEQVVRLIRSKGVGIYFITQNPLDLPESVLGQLGNRVQHALRAFTAKDRQAIKQTADNYPTSDYYKTDEVLTSLGIGEAFVTALNEKGIPTPLATLLEPITNAGWSITNVVGLNNRGQIVVNVTNGVVQRVGILTPTL